MPTIGIFKLGYSVVDVNHLCRYLNRAQVHYEFRAGTPILNMGKPDLSGYGYSDDALVNCVRPHLEEYDYSIIIVSIPLEENFFTRTIDRKIIIATMFQSDELLAKSKKTGVEYISLTICQELISFEFQRVTGQHWSLLFHQDTRGCIFDFVGIKSQKIAKLATCDICDECRGKLASSNLDKRIISAIDAILRNIRQPTIRKAVLYSILSPGLGFVYGGLVIGAAVNVLSSLVTSHDDLTRNQLIVILVFALSIPLFPLIVYGWHWFNHLRNRFR